MSIFSKNESGTSFHRSRFTRSISNTMRYDCRFHDLIPVLKRFVLPGDIWRIGGDVLVRFHPMVAPSLTPNNFRVRYFFVPLRLIEPDTELIITGSKDGMLYAPTEDHPDTPVFKNFVADADKVKYPKAFKVEKYSLWDYLGIQIGDYEAIKTNACLPAQYWQIAYNRIWWDYYRDENLDAQSYGYTDFSDLAADTNELAANNTLWRSNLAKDYFTSSLPFQLKGIAPRIDVTGTASLTVGDMFKGSTITAQGGVYQSAGEYYGDEPFFVDAGNGEWVNSDGTVTENLTADEKAQILNDMFATKFGNINITQLGFTADDLRTMMAQTRIFERLARCGSRYTEYLRANFGAAPADETLQRAQYLGGWKVPIVTTEVLQTAEDGSTPVGTMRGHGITRGGNRISTFYAKEFGVILGIAEIRPNVEYTTGIPRELTYKSRFDFFNPSLQHLSEQEVRNGELFVSFTDGKNDDTFGFQAYANELRTAHDETVGDLRDSLSFWTQSLHFTSRPNLDHAFIYGGTHLASFNAPFAVNNVNARPIIVQFRNNLDVYRPMVRYATPGLVDHL